MSETNDLGFYEDLSELEMVERKGISFYKWDENEEYDLKYSKELEQSLATDYITDEQKAKNPIIKSLLQLILDEAIIHRATDVQVSILTNDVMVRYRIDSKMVNYRYIEFSAFDALSCRVKLLGGMDVKEARVPQDGRFTHFKLGVGYDIRVSTLPTNKGENISLRLLYNSDLNTNLENLHIRENVLKKYREAIMSREGLILLTGPTGSGKTTTLYTTVGELILKYGESKNIMTIEDPVEYKVDRIIQSQVNLIREYDFVDGLRSILRQNPDIILVGEIRDIKTAETAVRASNTGHLVFSTLHASDAVSTAIVMKQLGIEPYNISNSLKIVLNQRLTGKLCHCKKERILTSYERGYFPEIVKTSIPVGCSDCSYRGYSGLVLLIEMVVVDDLFRDMIFRKMTANDMKKELKDSENYYGLREDLINHVLDGDISITDAIHLS